MRAPEHSFWQYQKNESYRFTYAETGNADQKQACFSAPRLPIPGNAKHNKNHNEQRITYPFKQDGYKFKNVPEHFHRCLLDEFLQF
jgi:hypothetical protein